MKGCSGAEQSHVKDRQTVVTILHGMWKIIPLLYINTRKYMMLGKRELKICRRIQVQGGGRERIYSAHTVLPCIIRPPMTYVYLMEQFFLSLFFVRVFVFFLFVCLFSPTTVDHGPNPLPGSHQPRPCPATATASFCLR